MTVSDHVNEYLDNFDDGLGKWEMLEDTQRTGGTVYRSYESTIEGTKIIRTVYVDIVDFTTAVEYASMYSELIAKLWYPEEGYPYFELTSKGIEHPAYKIVHCENQKDSVVHNPYGDAAHEFQLMEWPWISHVVWTISDKLGPEK